MMKIPIPEMQRWLASATPEERKRVAEASGISVGYLWLIAGGHRKPSEEVAANLDKATAGKVSAFSFFPRLAALAGIPAQAG